MFNLKASPEEIEARELAKQVVKALTHSKDILPFNNGLFDCVINVKTGLTFKAVDSTVEIGSVSKGAMIDSVTFRHLESFTKILKAYDIPDSIIDETLSKTSKNWPNK